MVIVKCPCRLGEQFTYCQTKSYKALLDRTRLYFTGLGLFQSELKFLSEPTIYAEKELPNPDKKLRFRDENVSFLMESDSEFEPKYILNIPDSFFTDIPLSDMGANTKKQGHLTGIVFESDTGSYQYTFNLKNEHFRYYSKSQELDKYFEKILPIVQKGCLFMSSAIEVSKKQEAVVRRDSSIIAAEINTIKARTQKEILSASIEIGQRLCEAKEVVGHGQWTQWLKEQVSYSQSTANNLMKVYREYGDKVNLLGGEESQTFGNLNYSQAIALFAVPEDQREDFVKENDVENMSARQLQATIKKMKEAYEKGQKQIEAEKEELRAKNKALEEERQKIENQYEGQKKLYENAVKSRSDAEEKLKENTEAMQKEIDALKNAPKTLSDKEIQKLRDELKAKITADFKKKEEKLSSEKKTAEEKAVEIEREYQEQLKKLELDKESLLKKQEEAEKKLALAAPDAQRFEVHFNNFQKDYQSMHEALQSLVKNGNQDSADKLKKALEAVIQTITLSLQNEQKK